MAHDIFPAKSREQQCFAAFVVLSSLAVGLLYHANLWTFDANGFSILSDRLPYWDFTNLWAGSKMALQGHVRDLFDVEAYRANLRAMFSPLLPDQEWSYPPNIILIGAPLAMLPIFAAYVAWTAGTIALLHLALRPMSFPPLVHCAAVLSPAVFMNAIFGQNGALTAALLIGGLLLAPARPILAGVLFGLLTIKPHLGILIPFCLLASWNWRAIVSAGVTAITLALATGIVLGFEVWWLFIEQTGPLMTYIMQAPYPQPYHANAMTVFILARAAGAGVTISYAAQGIATLATIAIVVWLWRPANAIDHRRRVAITATLAIVATPYGYTYDTIPMCVALAYLYASSARPSLALIGLAWMFPYAVHLLNFKGIGIGVLVPIAVAAWLTWDALSAQRAGDPSRMKTVLPAS